MILLIGIVNSASVTPVYYSSAQKCEDLGYTIGGTNEMVQRVNIINGYYEYDTGYIQLAAVYDDTLIKGFDWEITSGTDEVKAVIATMNGESNVYTYIPFVTSDTNLRSPDTGVHIDVAYFCINVNTNALTSSPTIGSENSNESDNEDDKTLLIILISTVGPNNNSYINNYS